MTSKKRTTTDAVEILHRLYIKDDPKRIASLEAEALKSEIAQHIYELREAASLTQKQLAAHVGTTTEAIDNLEMTDYEDHELGNAVLMFQRIAKALDQQVEFRLVEKRTELSQAEPQPQHAAS